MAFGIPSPSLSPVFRTLATVVDVNVANLSLTVSVVLARVLSAVAAVCLTQTVWPLEMVPLVVVNVPLQPTEYDPPVTLIDAGVVKFVPVIGIAFDVMVAPGVTFA